ncbi:MAG TPA: hypothetical protein VNW47_04260 [Terriglobales bacterium]|nr:hypothetical protein [Terriglobales bacterium]
MKRFHLGAGDFNWAYDAAHRLLAGEDPYAYTPRGAIPYPLPAALVAMPFALLSRELAGAMFFGASSGLLAFGLVRENPQRLLIFLAYPYWAALLTAQWTPLLMCAGLFPLACVFSLTKPNIGGPIALTHITRKGVIASAALLLASLLWVPRWPLEWISQLGGYEHFFPLLIVPGPLLVLALWRYRDRDALLLALLSVTPQRWFYDSFALWLIPRTRRSILATVACSWLVGIWRWYHTPSMMRQVGLWSVLGFYVPMLVLVLIRARLDSPEVLPTTSATDLKE